MTKRGKSILAISLLAVFILVGVGAYFFEKRMYEYRRLIQMDILNMAMSSNYYGKHKEFPPNLATVEAEGWYGHVPYREPRRGFLNWDHPTGPRPFYLPVHNWDEKTEFILAVTATPNSERIFIVARVGGKGPQSIPQAGLLKRLAEEDALRERTGQAGRWLELPGLVESCKSP